MYAYRVFKRTAIVVALSATFPFNSALAQDEAELMNPNRAEVSVGVIYVDDPGAFFTQYSGIDDTGVGVKVGVDYLKRSDEGAWLEFKADDIGQKTQQFGVSYEKQGDWSIGLTYDQLPRYHYVEAYSDDNGVGTPVVTNAANPLARVPLDTERKTFNLFGNKYLTRNIKANISVKTENKEGLKFAGITSFNLVPEPIDQRTTQIDASLDFSGDKYQVTAGYYGSLFNNSYETLAFGATVLALPPDNSLHQLYASGSYMFTKDTKGTAKISYSQGRQTDATSLFPFSTFPAPNGIPPNLVVNDLDGKITTTEVYGALTSRLTDQAKLLATWRYEDRDDDTPYIVFNDADRDMHTRPESSVTHKGKVEINYDFKTGYDLTAGLDYSYRNKSKPYTYFEVYDRKKIEETTARLGLRKSLSEALNGSVMIAHSDRDGSDWVTPLSLSASDGPVYPLHTADRKRDKLRGMLDWAASEKVNLEAVLEGYRDDFNNNFNGLREGKGAMVSLDASYRMNDDWTAHAWYSKDFSKSDRKSYGQPPAGGASIAWYSTLKLNSDQLGIGLNGKVGKLDVGAEYQYVHDIGEEEISSSVLNIIPDTKYKQNIFKLHGTYPVRKDIKIRMDYAYLDYSMDDFTWQNLSNINVYPNGGRAFLDKDQSTHFVGITLTKGF